MLKKKYQNQIKKIILNNLKGNIKNGNVKIFIFGSGVNDKKFNDIDVGIIGKNIDESKLSLIREDFDKSQIPYKIDLINFNQTDKKFRDKALKGKIIWLIPGKN